MDEDLPLILFTSKSQSPCLECRLVLESRGISSQIVSIDGGYGLVVDPQQEDIAKLEISAYLQENLIDKKAEKSIATPAHYPVKPALIGYVILMCGISSAAGYFLFNTDWYAQGRVDSVQIFAGQWYRLVTALTLHANAQHLLSNLGFGLLFLHYCSRFLGYGLASLAVLMGGIFGNLINITLRDGHHLSIGASTAIFAALGLLSLYSWQMRYYSQQRWAKRMGPIFGGIALLAFTGVGGPNTDIGAHFWGFVAGALTGWLLARFNEKIRFDPLSQKRYASGTAFIVFVAWLFAITT